MVEETRSSLDRKSCMAEYGGPIGGCRSCLPVRYEQFQFQFQGPAAVSFCISWQVDLFLDMLFLLIKLFLLLLARRGDVAITAVYGCLQFLNP
jgi:hypothetical protein